MRPGKQGVALRFDEWDRLMNLEPEVRRVHDRLMDAAAAVASPPRKQRKPKLPTAKQISKTEMTPGTVEQAQRELPGEKRKRPGKKLPKIRSGKSSN